MISEEFARYIAVRDQVARYLTETVPTDIRYDILVCVAEELMLSGYIDFDFVLDNYTVLGG